MYINYTSIKINKYFLLKIAQIYLLLLATKNSGMFDIWESTGEWMNKWNDTTVVCRFRGKVSNTVSRWSWLECGGPYHWLSLFTGFLGSSQCSLSSWLPRYMSSPVDSQTDVAAQGSHGYKSRSYHNFLKFRLRKWHHITITAFSRLKQTTGLAQA